MGELEREVEKALRLRVEALGGLCEKFTSPAKRAVPDRICLFAGGRVVFVECKAPGKRPTRLQTKDHERRRALGFDVRVIDSVEAANAFTL